MDTGIVELSDSVYDSVLTFMHADTSKIYLPFHTPLALCNFIENSILHMMFHCNPHCISHDEFIQKSCTFINRESSYRHTDDHSPPLKIMNYQFCSRVHSFLFHALNAIFLKYFMSTSSSSEHFWNYKLHFLRPGECCIEGCDVICQYVCSTPLAFRKPCGCSVYNCIFLHSI